VLPGLEELVVNKDLNLGVEALATAMGEKRFSRAFPTDVLGCKVYKLIW
jgi:hypothetical protein